MGENTPPKPTTGAGAADLLGSLGEGAIIESPSCGIARLHDVTYDERLTDSLLATAEWLSGPDQGELSALILDREEFVDVYGYTPWRVIETASFEARMREATENEEEEETVVSLTTINRDEDPSPVGTHNAIVRCRQDLEELLDRRHPGTDDEDVGREIGHAIEALERAEVGLDNVLLND